MSEDPRSVYRRTIAAAWQKHRQQLPLTALEQQLVALISEHPDYIPLLEQPTEDTTHYTPEDNPFLHLSLHLSLRDQLQLDRPAGIRDIYQQLILQGGSAHEVEHRMMELMAALLWQAQQTGQPPEEQDYLRKLQLLVAAGR